MEKSPFYRSGSVSNQGLVCQAHESFQSLTDSSRPFLFKKPIAVNRDFPLQQHSRE
jgi:hypothetical protein